MAEAHPVGLPVGDGGQGARARRSSTSTRGSPAPARSPTCTCRSGPARDIAFLGGADQPRARATSWTSASTSSPTPTPPTIVDEDFQDTEDLDGLFSGFDPETGTYDPTTLAVRRRERRPTGDRRSRRRTTAAAARDRARGRCSTRPHGSGGAPARKPQRDETLQHPRCVFQILKRHFARYTPEMVAATSAASRPRQFARGRRRAHRELRPRAHHRARSTRSAGPSTASARSTSAPARSCSCCSATWAAPAAASWRCAGTPASRAPPTSRRCSTCCPATCRCRTPASTTTLDDWIDAHRHAGPRGFWGNSRAYMVSLLKAYWGDAATAENDFCFDYLPRITGDHGTYRTVLDMIDGKVQGLLPGRGEPGRRLGQRQDAAARHGQPRLAGRPRPAR